MSKETESPLAMGMPEAPKLDLSKIKNLEAIEKKNDSNFVKEINKKIKKETVSKAKSKFNFTEEYDIQLPSLGKYYKNEEDENIRNGVITIKPMSIAEEEMMSNQNYIKNGSMFRRVFDSVTMNNFECKKLIPYDSLFLMYTLRKISYGDDYNITLKCPECERQFEYELNISDVEFEELKGEPRDSITINLPVSKYTVEMSITRLEDDEELERVKKIHSDVPELILGYVVKTIEILDDSGEPLDPKDWIDFYTALPVKDRAAITKNTNEDGKAPTIDVACSHCETISTYAIPFQSDFFRAQ